MTAQRPAPSGKGQQGFTLVELMIGLTLTVFIVTALFGGLRLATRVWETHGTQNMEVNEIRLARDWLRRYLEQAHPVLIEEQPGERVVAFTGARDYIRFVAPLPAHLGGGGLDWITLSVLDTGDHRGLNVEHRLFHPEPLNPVSDGVVERRVLLNELTDLKFGFYGIRDAGEGSEDPPAWHEDWVDQETLPTRISVSAEFSGRPRRWPPLIVVPMIDGELRETSPLISQASAD